MARQQKPTDPHASREAERYQRPVPSREFVLDYLHESVGPLTHGEICAGLQLVDDDQIEAMRRRLRAMERDGQIMVNRRGAYALVDRMDLLHCRVQGHRDGYGFAIPMTEGEDVYLGPRQMHFVFNGDEVLVQVTGEDRRGRLEGKVVEVLQRGQTSFVGRYEEESGIGFVIPDNGRISQQILIPPNEKSDARPGQVVTVEVTDYPTRKLGAKGRIAEVLGDHLDPGMEIDVAIRSHGIPWEWSEEVLAEASALEDEPLTVDKQHRVDLRKLAFVTIDGEDARDFDDAVYCERRKGGGWRLCGVYNHKGLNPCGGGGFLASDADAESGSSGQAGKLSRGEPQVVLQGLRSWAGA